MATLKEMQAQPTRYFIQLKEIARHPGGYEGWKAEEQVRIAKARPAMHAWVRKTVNDL